LLLELLAIRLDDGQDRLPRRRRIGMDQKQDLRLLVIDASISPMFIVASWSDRRIAAATNFP
jgi:hypothetical protein